MLTVSNLSLQYGKRTLFEDVNLKFSPGNCYGVIGANGSGKSTFLKILNSEVEPTRGNISCEKGERISFLKQDHSAYNDYTVLDTVVMGNSILWKIKTEKDKLYEKENFTEADGIKASNLEEKFNEMDGWNAETKASELLAQLGFNDELSHKKMGDLDPKFKVKVLLAQALFGNPENLLLDEPTNDLDFDTISWLENFIVNFQNTVIVVSHDRYFLDNICTSIVDIDRQKIKMYTGNYTFWYQSSQLALKQSEDKKKKDEDKRKELMSFVARFSANASKSRQATSRKKLLEKIVPEEITPSTRRYPGIFFKPLRDLGDKVMHIKNLSYTNVDKVTLFKDVSFTINKGDKIALLSKDDLIIRAFFDILAGDLKQTSGVIDSGPTLIKGYLPLENNQYFLGNENLIDWLRQYSVEQDETFIRGFLGRMLFSGEETFKKTNVLSGGEKVRCMLSKIMLESPNFLFIHEPVNHLDLEAITAFNNALIDFTGNILISSHDREFIQSVANRIIEIGYNGMIDKISDFENYTKDPAILEQRKKIY